MGVPIGYMFDVKDCANLAASFVRVKNNTQVVSLS